MSKSSKKINAEIISVPSKVIFGWWVMQMFPRFVIYSLLCLCVQCHWLTVEWIREVCE